MADSEQPVINAVHEERFGSHAAAFPHEPSGAPKTRLMKVAAALSALVAPYVDRAVVSLAPQAQISDIDGTTLAVVCPVGSRKGKLRNGLVETAYTYEVGILRLLGDGESLEDCVAVSESVSAALLSTGILPCDAEISDVENAFLDAQLVRRRRQFTAVLTVEVGDCLLMEPGGGA